MKSQKFETTDQYIATFPEPTQRLLNQMRAIVKAAAPPHAKEVISYNMPAIKVNGVLVYYAGYKKHIGFYPTALPMQVFKTDMAGYKTSKGAVQFPLNKPLPVALITRITRFRAEVDSEKTRNKQSL